MRSDTDSDMDSDTRKISTSDSDSDTDSEKIWTSDSDTDSDTKKDMTSDSDTGSDMRMSGNLGHGFGLGQLSDTRVRPSLIWNSEFDMLHIIGINIENQTTDMFNFYSIRLQII